MGAALCAAFRLRCPRGSEAGEGKRPNHRIQGLKADVLPFAPEGGRGFGSVFRHQDFKALIGYAGRGLSLLTRP